MLFRYLSMPLSDLEAYHRSRRAVRYAANEPFRGIGWRNRLHGMFTVLLPLSRILSRRKLTVLNRTRPLDGRPTIFACTHVGRYDIETGLELAGLPCWFLMGDPGGVYRSFDGLLLFLNGIIFLDTAYKEDRHIGRETCVKALDQGANLLIFPEGAWNITENQVVMPLFDGVAEMAIRTGAQILPMAIEQYGNQYYANMGAPILPDGYAQKKRLTEKLREELCGLKWEIWNQFPTTRRDTLPPDAAEKFLDSIMSQSENGYTVAEIERTRYHDKTQIPPEEAFAHLDHLIPSRENAFLLRRR